MQEYLQLFHWKLYVISGNGSWANIVECLHQAGFNYLASVFKEMYEYGRWLMFGWHFYWLYNHSISIEAEQPYRLSPALACVHIVYDIIIIYVHLWRLHGVCVTVCTGVHIHDIVHVCVFVGSCPATI